MYLFRRIAAKTVRRLRATGGLTGSADDDVASCPTRALQAASCRRPDWTLACSRNGNGNTRVWAGADLRQLHPHPRGRSAVGASLLELTALATEHTLHPYAVSALSSVLDSVPRLGDSCRLPRPPSIPFRTLAFHDPGQLALPDSLHLHGPELSSAPSSTEHTHPGPRPSGRAGC